MMNLPLPSEVLNATAEATTNGSLFHLLILSSSHYKYEKTNRSKRRFGFL